MSNIRFIMLSALFAATCVTGDEIKSRKGMESTTMPQKIQEKFFAKFSADVPFKEPMRKDGTMTIELTPQCFYGRKKPIAQGQKIEHVIHGTTEFENGKSVKFPLPRDVRRGDMIVWADVFKIRVIMNYWGNDKMGQACIATFNANLKDLHKKGYVEFLLDNTTAPARLTIGIN